MSMFENVFETARDTHCVVLKAQERLKKAEARADQAALNLDQAVSASYAIAPPSKAHVKRIEKKREISRFVDKPREYAVSELRKQADMRKAWRQQQAKVCPLNPTTLTTEHKAPRCTSSLALPVETEHKHGRKAWPEAAPLYDPARLSILEARTNAELAKMMFVPRPMVAGDL